MSARGQCDTHKLRPSSGVKSNTNLRWICNVDNTILIIGLGFVDFQYALEYFTAKITKKFRKHELLPISRETSEQLTGNSKIEFAEPATQLLHQNHEFIHNLNVFISAVRDGFVADNIQFFQGKVAL